MFIESKQNSITSFWKYVLYVFFAIFPFFIFNNFLYQGTSSRFLLLTLVSSVCIIPFGVYILKNRKEMSFLSSPILWVGLLYVLYVFMAGFLGADFSVSFWSRAERTSGLFYLIHLAFFALVLVNLFWDNTIRKNLVKVVVWTSALYSFATFLGKQGLGWIFKNNPYDGFMFGNSSFAAMYLLGAFFLSLYYFFLEKKEGKLAWYNYLLPILIVLNPFFFNMKGGYDSILSIVGIAQASSFALYFSIGALGVVWLVSKIQNIKIKNIVAIALVSVSMLGMVLGTRSLLKTDGVVREFYSEQSSKARLLVWEISKQALQEKPLTGWGNDNFTVAFQKYFDIRLLTEEYGNEGWFDRAHNIVLDQAVDGGYLGVILFFVMYAVIIVSMLYAALKTKQREHGLLASLLLVYFFVHLFELQTAFETTISAVMFAFMFSLAVYVLYMVKKEEGVEQMISCKKLSSQIVAGILVGFFSWTLLFGTLPFWKVQIVNGNLRTVGTAEKRIPLYPKIFNTKVDPAGVLWRTSNDFQRGISEAPQILENPQKVEFLSKEVEVIIQGHEEYIAKHPDTYRTRLGLADLYMYQMLFGINHLDEANRVLDEAIEVDGDKHPQPYWMKAVLFLYKRDSASARKNVEIAKSMNADVVQTQVLEAYIEESIRTFPEIDLFFFDRI